MTGEPEDPTPRAAEQQAEEELSDDALAGVDGGLWISPLTLTAPATPWQEPWSPNPK